jgi:hypothetical protein
MIDKTEKSCKWRGEKDCFDTECCLGGTLDGRGGIDGKTTGRGYGD